MSHRPERSTAARLRLSPGVPFRRLRRWYPTPPARPCLLTALEDAGLRFARIGEYGAWHAPCPACRTFGALTVDPDGRAWRSACGCYGSRPLGELAGLRLALDLLLAAP